MLESLLWQGRGVVQGTALAPLVPRKLPESPAVVPRELAGGAGDRHRVAAQRVGEEPGRLVGAGIDAAVADVRVALGPEGVLGVDVFAAVGDAYGVVDHHVVEAGLALLAAGGDHADRVALVHGQVDAAGRGVFAGGGHA